jgi:hypothetical protein
VVGFVERRFVERFVEWRFVRRMDARGDVSAARRDLTAPDVATADLTTTSPADVTAGDVASAPTDHRAGRRLRRSVGCSGRLRSPTSRATAAPTS